MPFDSLDDIYKRRSIPSIPLTIASVILLIALVGWLVSSCSSSSDDADVKEESASTAKSESAKASPSGEKAASAQSVSNSAPASTGATPALPPVSLSEASRTPSSSGGLASAAYESVLSEADKLEKDGDLWNAREKLLASLPKANVAQANAIEQRIGKLSVDLFMTSRPCPGKVQYTIKGGDRIDKIRNAYECPSKLIMRCNGIKDPTKIQIGQKLVFPDHPKFQVIVSKSRNTLELRLNGKFFKRYIVSTGSDSSTPVGTFEIVLRQEHPDWKGIPYGDKRNILGTHWLQLKATGSTPQAAGYGIHGTWDDSSLGKQASAGCVRLRNSDVEELFVLLPLHTPVTIVD